VKCNARTGKNKLWAAGGAGFSSATDNWATPPHVFAALDAEFSFTLDACASAGNAKCERFFTAADDGLAQSWAPETTWMNPPYGRGIGEWMEKAADEAERGATVVCLVPARTDTKWWHEQVMARASEVRLVRGRLKFGAGLAPAPFPSALVVYRPLQAALVVDVWAAPADTAQAARRLSRPGSDDQNSMKSSRRPSLAACPANDESSTRRPHS
jgi:phage N-6-adenine-methyltransferase